jgi:Fic family protein
MFVAKGPAVAEMLKRLPSKAIGETVAAPFGGHKADERYLHWDKLRHLDPPPGLTTEQWWLRLKLARAGEMRHFPLVDSSGESFGFTLPDVVLRQLHYIDQHCSGEVAMEEVVTSDQQARNRYLVNAQVEEAIRSSQLEGATTSRVVAKEMLRSGREPRDRSERMIVNNYRALQFMHEEMKGELDHQTIMQLHRIVTDGTLADPTAAGRFQQPGEDRVVVVDRDGGRPLHVPPPAEQLPARMALMCEFANEKDEGGETFVHPVIRAILLHFWLAYDHPFEDGNGRTARILFFWLMRSHGYWLVEYLPISRIIRNAPAQYGRAFLETEADEGDATYFLIHQLEILRRAIDELRIYLRRKQAEVRDVERLLDETDHLNGRQLALLTDAIRDSDAVYTFESHAKSHRVSHETARVDLRQLADRDLLLQRRRGRQHIFEPAPDLGERLKESAA